MANARIALRIKIAAPRIASADSRKVKPPPKRADPIYSTPEFRRWRSEVIRRSGGCCQDPEHDPSRSRTGKLYADHIRELRDGGAPFDPMNGMTRCASCHERKTHRERARRLQG